MHCTAAGCETAAQTISAAQSESNQSNTDAGTAQANLEAALDRARHRMTGLRQELTQRIGEDDDRWYAFGFDKPGDPITPEVPENLTAIPGAPGSRTLFLHCDDARRADSYRFRVTAVAGGAQVGEKLSDEPEAMIDGLPPPGFGSGRPRHGLAVGRKAGRRWFWRSLAWTASDPQRTEGVVQARRGNRGHP